MIRPSALFLVALLGGAPYLSAQDVEAEPAGSADADEAVADEIAWQEFVDSFEWKTDGEGALDSQAVIAIPEGYRFTDGASAQGLLQAMGNIVETPPAGLIGVPDLDWFVVFRFDPTGYVSDEEKDDLDADKMLKEFQESDKYSNEARIAAGYPTLDTVGWAKEPFYNEETNNLEWGLILQSGDGSRSVNYKTNLLGRRGVMDLILVCDPEDLDAILPEYQELITGFDYTDGNKYAQYEDGDKLAKYGLTALVVGGAAALGAKAGLFGALGAFLAKSWKLVVAGIVAIGVAIKKLFGFGKNTYSQH